MVLAGCVEMLVDWLLPLAVGIDVIEVMNQVVSNDNAPNQSNPLRKAE